MTERPGPDEVIELGAVTLRRYRDDDLDDLVRAVGESEDHRWSRRSGCPAWTGWRSCTTS